MGLVGKPAPIDPHLGDDGLRIHDIDVVDLGQVGPADSVKFASQIKRSGSIVASFFVGLRRRQLAWKFGLALEGLQICLQGDVALGDLLLIDMMQIQPALVGPETVMSLPELRRAGGNRLFSF